MTRITTQADHFAINFPADAAEIDRIQRQVQSVDARAEAIAWDDLIAGENGQIDSDEAHAIAEFHLQLALDRGGLELFNLHGCPFK